MKPKSVTLEIDGKLVRFYENDSLELTWDLDLIGDNGISAGYIVAKKLIKVMAIQ